MAEISDYTLIKSFTMTGSEVEIAVPANTVSLLMNATGGTITIYMATGASTHSFTVTVAADPIRLDCPDLAGRSFYATGTASHKLQLLCTLKRA